MPSFKRREPALAQRKLVNGLRSAPYPSIVPLFSTGLASLDDVLSGSGLPSSSILALCPALGLATLSSEEQYNQERLQVKPVTIASGSSQTLEALEAAEDVALDLLSYSIAQGLVSGHETLVIGKEARNVVQDRVPSRAIARDYGQTADQKPDDSMTIAFRYAHRPKFKTTVDEPEVLTESSAAEVPEEHLFRAPFDMSKRWKGDEVQACEERERGRLRIVERETYEEAWRAIEEEAERCKKISLDKKVSPPALRIHLPCLGLQAASTGFDTRLVHLSHFMGRLRRLLKDLSLHEQAPIHSICILTLSPNLLVPQTSTKMTTLHLSRFVDAQLLISDFGQYPHLRKAYLGYGGGISLLKGPSIGFLLPPGESRSVLRGGTAEAGAENDVGWKRRKKGVVLETLHEDVDAGVKEKEVDSPGNSKKKTHGVDDIEEAALGLSRKDANTPMSASAAPASSAATRPARVKFEGLKSLRERGLRATKQGNVQVEKSKEW